MLETSKLLSRTREVAVHIVVGNLLKKLNSQYAPEIEQLAVANTEFVRHLSTNQEKRKLGGHKVGFMNSELTESLRMMATLGLMRDLDAQASGLVVEIINSQMTLLTVLFSCVSIIAWRLISILFRRKVLMNNGNRG